MLKNENHYSKNSLFLLVEGRVELIEEPIAEKWIVSQVSEALVWILLISTNVDILDLNHENIP